MNRYRTSSGELIDKSIIDANVVKAKKQKIAVMIDKYGYVFCETCGINSNHHIIDCSHDISVNDCQRDGMSELAWDVNNITMRCRDCHTKHDHKNKFNE
ncbi:MAG: hypothetical protein ACRDDZ_01455 [Marinifilaceae bacterium]